jgi:Cof subfamily protein (haloacid dehalogenase superfamily)
MTQPFPYSLVAIDLDGTLLTATKQITQNSVNTLRKLHDDKVKIVLASGRMSEKMITLYRDVLDIHDAYVIGYNGAKCIYLQSATEHEQVFHYPIPQALFDPLLNYCKNLCLIFYWNGKCVTLKKHENTELINVFAEITNNPTWEFINSYEDAKHLEITNALVIVNEEAQADAILRDLRQAFANEKVHLVKTDCATHDHHQFYVEILNPEANKGNALKNLCEKLSIDPQRVIAFGDGENDIEMLAFAGHGVCMLNASEKVKQLAKFITTHSNHEEGVHIYLQSIIPQ